ncbi:putative bifunctional diguanylate cyclase/phosphodiesterase [Angustibacter luteus]
MRLRRAVMLGSGLAFALLLLGLALTPVDRGVVVTLGAVFSGVVAAVVGAVVCLKAGRGNRLLRLAAVLIGAAMMVWAAGQFLIGYASSTGTPHYPTAGDKLSLVAAPLAVSGLVLAMRPTSLRTHWLRMLADALLLSSATAMLLWRVTLYPVLATDGFGVDAYIGLVTVLVEAYLCALLLLGWLRDLDLGLGLVLVGFVLYVAADQFTMLQAVQGHAWPVVAAALWCLAWPLIGEGFITFRPAMSDDDGRSSETRVAVATTLVGFTALVGALVHIAIRPTIDPVTVSLSILVVAAYALRELYGGIQRGRLLGVLTDQAMHDPLTGLGNRRAMQAGLARLAAEPAGAVLTLDLDGFKEVNDLLGHGLGDQLLVAVAERIRDAMPGNAEAYRVGGDEFVVLVPGEQECSTAVAEALLAGVRRATESLPEADVAGVSASVGVARWSQDDDESAHDAVRPRDPAERAALAILESGVALHAAKESGRDRVESYDGPVAARHRRGLDVERRLRIALAKGDLDVHYQPILALDTGRVVSVEALARWTDPVLGRVGPDEFIAVAERSALIGELGSYVLNRAVGDVRGLSEQYPDLRVAVNVSPIQLRAAAFADHVAVLVARHGLAPQRLVIEVTESLFVSDDGVGLRNLQRLRRRGIEVAIDDFGSGYSSLNYLSRLPASILKVDQVLTRSIAEDPRSLSVLRAVVELGRSLPMQVVAEGIETQEMHDIVRGFGQCLGQGWLYSAAVPLDQLPDAITAIQARETIATA